MAFGFVKTLQTQRIHKPTNCAPKQPVLALLLANPSIDTSIESRSLLGCGRKKSRPQQASTAPKTFFFPQQQGGAWLTARWNLRAFRGFLVLPAPPIHAKVSFGSPISFWLAHLIHESHLAAWMANRLKTFSRNRKKAEFLRFLRFFSFSKELFLTFFSFLWIWG